MIVIIVLQCLIMVLLMVAISMFGYIISIPKIQVVIWLLAILKTYDCHGFLISLNGLIYLINLATIPVLLLTLTNGRMVQLREYMEAIPRAFLTSLNGQTM